MVIAWILAFMLAIPITVVQVSYYSKDFTEISYVVGEQKSGSGSAFWVHSGFGQHFGDAPLFRGFGVF